MILSRRTFCTSAAAAAGLLSSRRLRSQTAPGTPPATTRPDVAAIDRDRIVSAARHWLTVAPRPLTSTPEAQRAGTPHDLFSTSVDPDSTIAVGKAAPEAVFSAHSDAALEVSLAVPALVAGSWVTRKDDPAESKRFADHAAAHLRAWFVDPATSMTPSLAFAAIEADSKTGSPEGILETTGFAEVAQAVPFLARTDALEPAELTAVHGWFASFLTWLTTSRQAGLARDRKDHLGSSWLLQTAAYARLTANESALSELRHRFKTVTLRAEINSEGLFPHELTTPDPYRNSLFNLDLLAGACDLLSTRFESLWDAELQDGPGMRVVLARYAPYIESRSTWPYRADHRLFNTLPCRRPALLFAARAYQRPEYATIWRSLAADPTDPVILRSFPIRQPLLWTTRAQG